MTERLVDVLRDHQSVLHTFPVMINDPDLSSQNDAYEVKALEVAVLAQLVPNADLNHLTSRMHVGRSGPLAPFGDDCPVTLQTQKSIDQAIRERAYLLWRQDGSPLSRAEDFWHRAHEQYLREGAYALWHLEGCPEDRADEHWRRAETFALHDRIRAEFAQRLEQPPRR